MRHSTSAMHVLSRVADGRPSAAAAAAAAGRKRAQHEGGEGRELTNGRVGQDISRRETFVSGACAERGPICKAWQ